MVNAMDPNHTDGKDTRSGTTNGPKETGSFVQVADEEEGKKGAKHETEKLHVLEPIPSHIASFLDFPSQRTAFYLQTDDDKKAEEAPAAPKFEATKEKYVRKYDNKGYGTPEKVSVPDPRITHTHTTFYDKKNGLWRQDTAALVQQK